MIKQLFCKWFTCFAVLQFFVLQIANAADPSVEAAGTTATSITESAGHYTVDIAPKNGSGTSYNQYNRFNVPASGVSLDNRAVSATTIINEVTSPNPSLINGQLDVLGNKAHVIIANPWGITVNGGSFVNTAGLVLTTAGGTQGGFTSGISSIADGSGGFNTQLVTSEGIVTIGADGLAGAFNNLEIIAKRIKVQGAITNTSGNANARTRLTAGDSSTIVNASQDVNTPSDSWADAAGAGTSNPNEILVDISGIGSMTDSRISIVVTDQGAGVRSAGNVKSTSGEVFLSSEGEIQIIGGKITAATTATLNSEKNLSVTDAEIEGHGFVSLNSNNGDINLASSSSKTSISGEDIVLRSATGSVVNNGATVQSINDIEVEAHRNIINRTLSAAYKAIFDAGVDLTLTAANGDITNIAGRFIANDDLTISAVNGDVKNLLERESVANAGIIESYSRDGGQSLFRKRTIHGYRVNYGEATLPGEQAVFVANDHVNITSKNLNNTGGEIYSNNGNIDFTIGTAGDTSTGTVTIAALQTGSAWFETGCAWFCNRSGASSVELLGGFVQAANNLNIKANNVINSGGFVTAMKDMTITGLAGGKVDLVQAKALDMFAYSSFTRGVRGEYGNLQRFDQGGAFVANQGRLQIDSLKPVEINGGEISGSETVIENGTVIIRPKSNHTNITGLSIGFLSEVF